jgi:hypothetical protein
VSRAIHEGDAGGVEMGSGVGGAAGAVEGLAAGLAAFEGFAAGLGAGDGMGAGGVAGGGVALVRFHGEILEIQLGVGAAGVAAGAGDGAGGADFGGAAGRVAARAQEKPRQRVRKSGRAGSMDGKGNRRVWGPVRPWARMASSDWVGKCEDSAVFRGGWGGDEAGMVFLLAVLRRHWGSQAGCLCHLAWYGHRQDACATLAGMGGGWIFPVSRGGERGDGDGEAIWYHATASEHC